MFAWLQWIIIADEEEAHGGYQELKQLHQGSVTPIWPHLHPSQQLNNADWDDGRLLQMTCLCPILINGHSGDRRLTTSNVQLHQNNMCRLADSSNTMLKVGPTSMSVFILSCSCSVSCRPACVQSYCSTWSKLSIQCSPTLTRVSRPQSASNSGTSSPG